MYLYRNGRTDDCAGTRKITVAWRCLECHANDSGYLTSSSITGNTVYSLHCVSEKKHITTSNPSWTSCELNRPIHRRRDSTQLSSWIASASAVCIGQYANVKGAITSKIKHAIKLKTSPARLAQLVQPSIAFCFSLQPMTAHSPVLDGTPSLAAFRCKLKQNANEGCNSCATVVQVLQDLFYVLLHVLFYLWSLLNIEKRIRINIVLSSCCISAPSRCTGSSSEASTIYSYLDVNKHILTAVASTSRDAGVTPARNEEKHDTTDTRSLSYAENPSG